MFSLARNTKQSSTVRALIVLAILVGLALSSLGTPAVTQAAGPVFTSSPPPAGTYGTLYTHTFTTNTLATFAVSSGTLPLGLALAPTGLLTGIPLQSGQFALAVTAQSLLGSATQSFTLTINKVPLTITAQNKHKIYGDALPELTCVATGLVNSDTLTSVLTGALATSATPGSPAGTYPITQGTLSALNYAISFVPGTLTVDKAILTVTAHDQTRKVNTNNPPLTLSYSGFVPGDDAGALTTLPTASTTAGPNSPAGTYPITLNGGGALNYVLNLVDGLLTVADKDVPLISWSKPAAITFGTPLGTAQLKATASFSAQTVPGVFTYDPPAGRVLAAGSNQTLR